MRICSFVCCVFNLGVSGCQRRCVPEKIGGGRHVKSRGRHAGTLGRVNMVFGACLGLISRCSSNWACFGMQGRFSAVILMPHVGISWAGVEDRS